MAKRLRDVQLPFFIPLWRRVVLVAACFGWALFEWSMGNPLWAALFGAIGAYIAHQFFVAFDPPPKDGGRAQDAAPESAPDATDNENENENDKGGSS
jgi:hypothetical protein